MAYKCLLSTWTRVAVVIGQNHHSFHLTQTHKVSHWYVHPFVVNGVVEDESPVPKVEQEEVAAKGEVALLRKCFHVRASSPLPSLARGKIKVT